ncbi:gamma carbonic anhydrase family protein [Ectothiorhodospiraceae bacterium WFHF3C12]|nr:gamma carbonic anhydrase family protein [Ectothiorhodospiraceae bacterium WFHF3C12]
MIRRFEQYTPSIADSAYVDESAVVIGDVALAEDVSIWPAAVLRGDVNYIRVGARSNVQDGTVVHVTHAGPYTPEGGIPTVIGEDVTIGHKAIIHACTLGDRILIGMGATVMDGATVESDVILGANALVPPNKTLESGYLYVGSPVKQARALTDSEKEYLVYSARHYVRLKQRHEKG